MTQTRTLQSETEGDASLWELPPPAPLPYSTEPVEMSKVLRRPSREPASAMTPRQARRAAAQVSLVLQPTARQKEAVRGTIIFAGFCLAALLVVAVVKLDLLHRWHHVPDASTPSEVQVSAPQVAPAVGTYLPTPPPAIVLAPGASSHGTSGVGVGETADLPSVMLQDFTGLVGKLAARPQDSALAGDARPVPGPVLAGLPDGMTPVLPAESPIDLGTAPAPEAAGAGSAALVQPASRDVCAVDLKKDR